MIIVEGIMKKVISILVLFICAFAIIACETPHEHKFVNGSCESGKNIIMSM